MDQPTHLTLLGAGVVDDASKSPTESDRPTRTIHLVEMTGWTPEAVLEHILTPTVELKIQ